MTRLPYAGDIVLLDFSRDRMQKMTEAVETKGKELGLRMNVKKCKVAISKDWNDTTEVRTEDSAIELVEEFLLLEKLR